VVIKIKLNRVSFFHFSFFRVYTCPMHDALLSDLAPTANITWDTCEKGNGCEKGTPAT